MKTKLFLAIMALTLFSCSSKDEIGRGTNPELNVEKYTFKKDGGTLVVYSKIKCPLQILYNSSIDVNNGVTVQPTIKDSSSNGIVSIDGGWYSVESDMGKTITIKTTVNTTNKKREIPINIMSLDYGCKTQYIQE